MISEADNLIGGAEYDLAICKVYLILQRVFNEQAESLDKKALSAEFFGYKFKFGDNLLSAIETGLLKPIADAGNLDDLFKKDKRSALWTLQCNFFFRMYEKGFEFYLSGRLWDKMLEYCNENNKSAKTLGAYFNIKPSSFEKLIADFSAYMFLDNRSEMVAVLWGSVYIYGFLHERGIVSKEKFDGFVEMTRKLKGKVIGGNLPELWNFNFVHVWHKPDCILETEFEAENKIFTKSLTLKNKKFNELRGEIAEELSEIGEMSSSIIEAGGKEIEYDTSLLDKLFAPQLDGPDNYDDGSVSREDPETPPVRNFTTGTVVNEKKPGRNEPCPCGSGKKYKQCCMRK